MRREFLDLLACPACGARLIAPPGVDGGGLLCEACTCRFTTPDGMPVLMVGNTTAEDTTARAFAAQWLLRESVSYEQETLYGETAEQDRELPVPILV